MRIRKNDTVQVLAGKDKGKRGRIFRLKPHDGVAWVEGINVTKKAMKPKPNVKQAGIIDIELPIQISNIKLVCPSCNKPTKVLLKKNSDEVLDATKGIPRVCKLCQTPIQ